MMSLEFFLGTARVWSTTWLYPRSLAQPGSENSCPVVSCGNYRRGTKHGWLHSSLAVSCDCKSEQVHSDNLLNKVDRALEENTWLLHKTLSWWNSQTVLTSRSLCKHDECFIGYSSEHLHNASLCYRFLRCFLDGRKACESYKLLQQQILQLSMVLMRIACGLELTVP